MASSPSSRKAKAQRLSQTKAEVNGEEILDEFSVEMAKSGDILLKTTPMPLQETSVQGGFAAGDAATVVKQVVSAAASGVTAAAGITLQLDQDKIKEASGVHKPANPNHAPSLGLFLYLRAYFLADTVMMRVYCYLAIYPPGQDKACQK